MAPVVAFKNTSGGVAQLGERLHGMQEVRGSTPLTSTIPKDFMKGGKVRLKGGYSKRDRLKEFAVLQMCYDLRLA